MGSKESLDIESYFRYDVSMDEKQESEYKGRWWIPGEDIKIPGTLKLVTNEKALLELEPSEETRKMSIMHRNPKLILGHCPYPLGVGKTEINITLMNCYAESNLDYSARTVFLGAHFENESNIKFRDMYIKYSFLHEWAWISGFELTPLRPLPDVEQRMTINYRQPDAVPLGEFNGFKLSIDFLTTWPRIGGAYARKKATIEQESFIKLDGVKERSFEEYADIIWKVQNFLTLANHKPVYPLYVDATTESNKEEVKGNVLYDPIAIYDMRWKVRTKPLKFETLRGFFTFKDIRYRKENLVNKWLADYEVFRPIYRFYFAIIYKDTMYMENTFLTLVQAIEAYHRLAGYKNFVLDPQEHEERVKYILDSVDKYKDWLKWRIDSKSANEPSLKDRLKQIIDDSKKVSEAFVGDGKEFINKVVETRNIYMHPDERLTKKEPAPEELHALIYYQLQPLVEICLLRNLGLTYQEVRDFFAQSFWYGSRFRDRIK